MTEPSTLQKQEISLRYWLQGRDFHHALDAMDFGKRFHTSTRKDGSPEFSHQVAIGHFVRTLTPLLMHPEETMATVFLHDVREDYDVTDAEIRSIFREDRVFAEHVAKAVGALTKTFRGVKRDPHAVFEEIGADPVASIVKGADRGHNHRSMVGVFTIEKQKAYLAETEEFFFPMLKRARRCFPRQEMAYENIKHALVGEVDLIRAIHAAAEAQPARELDDAPAP